MSEYPEQLIDRIYEAGLMPSIWPALLAEVGAAVGGRGGFLFGVRDGYVSAINAPEHDPVRLPFLNDGWSLRDPTLSKSDSAAHSSMSLSRLW